MTNGVGVRRHGCICETSAQMVQLIDEEGLKFRRSKVNLERIARERTLRVSDSCVGRREGKWNVSNIVK